VVKWAPPSDEPLNTVDHTNFTVLMSLFAFNGQPRIALKGFKARWNKERMDAKTARLPAASLLGCRQRAAPRRIV
jgi:hypothetical protein